MSDVTLGSLYEKMDNSFRRVHEKIDGVKEDVAGLSTKVEVMQTEMNHLHRPPCPVLHQVTKEFSDHIIECKEKKRMWSNGAMGLVFRIAGTGLVAALGAAGAVLLGRR